MRPDTGDVSPAGTTAHRRPAQDWTPGQRGQLPGWKGRRRVSCPAQALASGAGGPLLGDEARDTAQAKRRADQLRDTGLCPERK